MTLLILRQENVCLKAHRNWKKCKNDMYGRVGQIGTTEDHEALLKLYKVKFNIRPQKEPCVTITRQTDKRTECHTRFAIR